MRKRPVGLGLVRICNTKCIWQRYRVFLTLDGESQQPSLYIRTEWRSNVQTSPVFLFSFKSFFGLQGKPSPPKPCFCLAVKQKQHMALEVLLNSVLTHFAWRGIVCAQHSHGDFCSWALRATLLIFWTPFSCRRGVGTFLLIDRVFFLWSGMSRCCQYISLSDRSAGLFYALVWDVPHRTRNRVRLGGKQALQP